MHQTHLRLSGINIYKSGLSIWIGRYLFTNTVAGQHMREDCLNILQSPEQPTNFVLACISIF